MLHASIPVPPILLRPPLWVFLAGRWLVKFAYRRLVCELIFRGYCRSVGRRFRTGSHVHWVRGAGDIVIGNDVTLHGKSAFLFAAGYSDAPSLTIGDHTTIGHGCTFVVAKRIDIGEHCLIADNVRIADSNGHPLDPAKRRAGFGPDPDEVQPVLIGNNVWVGVDVTVLPGVTIGEGAVVAARSVVAHNVAPNTLVGGYPARRVKMLVGEGARLGSLHAMRLGLSLATSLQCL